MHAPEAAESTRRAGPYLLVRRLGAGAMGTVYEGVHERTGARHAVKLLPPAAARSAEDLARFRREAALTARLSHEGIVRVHDLGLERPPYYIAMDLVEGDSLQVRLDRGGPFALDVALDIAARLAAALWHAHASGVIHRDLKPANVLLDAQGAPRLVDFGLARDAGALLERLTLTGEIVGTPRYIAPEQVLDSRAVDGRADVYGLGGVLFAMITGQPPIPGDDVPTVFKNVRDHVPPPPSSLRPGVPPIVDAICARALAKSPDERFRSAAEMLDALEAAKRVVAGAPTPTRSAPAAPRRRRPLPALVGAAALAAAAGAAALLAARPAPAPAEPARGPAPPVMTEAPQPPPGPLVVAPGRGAAIITPWSWRWFQERRWFVVSAVVAGPEGVRDAATLVLRPVVADASDEQATVTLEIARARWWDGQALRQARGDDEAWALIDARVVCTIAGGDVVDVSCDEAVAQVAAGLAPGAALRALLDPDALEALLAAVARSVPTHAEPELGPGQVALDEARRLRRALVEATRAGGERVDLSLAVFDSGAPPTRSVDGLHQLLSRRFEDAAALWLLNELPTLERPGEPRELLLPRPVAFGGDAPEVVTTTRAAPAFEAPNGPLLVVVPAGATLGAHERRGEWRQLCFQGAPVWVLDRGLLAPPLVPVRAVVITDRDAWAKGDPARGDGSGRGRAPRGAAFVVVDENEGVGKGPHLAIDYAGERCWILQRDTRPLR